jgi:uncharacterized protein YdeI (YjbR/CyaY-like superfamily)
MPRTAAVDAHIAKSADFARPILTKFRDLLHRACPEVQETLKWGVPHFEHHGVLAGMAGFKKHVNLIFWKADLMKDPAGLFTKAEGPRNVVQLKSMDEMPADKVLLAYVKEAAALNEQGIKRERKPAAKKPDLPVPADLRSALKKNKKAQAAFDAFPPSHRREYIEWITQAKQAETRARRLATALEWMAEGKPRNWKYVRK